jgi:hypothetical protein
MSFHKATISCHSERSEEYKRFDGKTHALFLYISKEPNQLKQVNSLANLDSKKSPKWVTFF